MNIKRILLLVLIFFFLIIVGTSNVFATNVIMSDEFIQTLKDEGKLVVTDTTMAEDKLTFLKDYVSKYNVDGRYWFEVNNYNEETSTCDITIHSGTVETHNVEIVYEEKISDDFKIILTDGKFKVSSSTKNGVVDKINSYFYKLAESNEDYQFRVATYGVLNEEESTEEDLVYDDVPYIDENCTKVTIQMRDKNWKLLEQHIVELSYLTEKSDEFKKELNKDGKLVFNSVKPNTAEEFWGLYELLFMMNNEEIGYGFGYESEDYSSVDFTIYFGAGKEETHRVDIEYNYNKGIDKKFQEFRNNFPEDIEYFQVRDLELINYWINNIETDDSEHLDEYSGELKALINNNNIEYYVDNRMGWNDIFEAGRKGIAIFKFKDIVYYINSFLGTEAENIIYVPNETGDTKEELMAAAQKRIDKYLGKQGNTQATISYAGTVKEAWCKAWYERMLEYGDEENPNMTLEEIILKYLPEEYEDFGRDLVGIDGVNENDDSFIVTIKVGDKEKSFNILIQRDSSKMVMPSYKTADMETNIEISTSDSSIPLDTNIRAEKLINGKDYERIIKILDLKENEMFDLKLYSDSLEDYITRLPNGEFEVRIPISEDFKHRNLKAYYVDENGKVEKYDIIKKDGYAIFKTSHFSIYTVAEEKTENEDIPFTDVSKNIWYYNAVKFTYERGMIKGITETTFDPNGDLTRGMLVTILWRMEGNPKVTTNKFTDVPSNIWYSNAVNWAANNRIVNGYGNGKFGPNDKITREQLAVMLRNYAIYKKKDVSAKTDLNKFIDSKNISSYAIDAVSWAVSNKVISGKAQGTKVDPHGKATRAEVAAMLYNYCLNIF